MAWHILAGSYFDFDAIERDAAADRVPRHFLRRLAQELNGSIQQPDHPDGPSTATVIDRLAATVFGEPAQWALARRVRRELTEGDAVYTAGSAAGMPLALLCSVFGPRRVRFAISVTDVQRPRTQVMGWLLVLLRARWVMIVPHDEMARTAARGFGRFAEGVMAINGLTDFEFFRPADTAESGAGDRPTTLIASCGTEARDYELLARATASLDDTVAAEDGVAVKVCFASPNLTAKTRYTVPDPLPDHMEIRYFSFVELRELYQQADVVVVPLLPNRYAAGLTTVLEALACGRPVVVARSPGVVQELIDRDLVETYEIGDLGGLRAAIERTLADPAAARIRAEAARTWVRSRFSTEAYLERIFAAVEAAFGATGSALVGSRSTASPVDPVGDGS